MPWLLWIIGAAAVYALFLPVVFILAVRDFADELHYALITMRGRI